MSYVIHSNTSHSDISLISIEFFFIVFLASDIIRDIRKKASLEQTESKIDSLQLLSASLRNNVNNNNDT